MQTKKKMTRVLVIEAEIDENGTPQRTTLRCTDHRGRSQEWVTMVSVFGAVVSLANLMMVRDDKI